jgi:AraC family transcriptional regulator
MIFDVVPPPSEPGLRYYPVAIGSARAKPVLADRLLGTSATGPWRGFVLERHATHAGLEHRMVFTPDHLVALPVRPPTHLEWEENGGPSRRLRIGEDEVVFIPAGFPFSSRSSEDAEFLTLTLTPGFVRCAAPDALGGLGQPTFRPQVPILDAFLARTLLALGQEVDRGFPGGRWYGEALATAVAAHVVRHFANRDGRSADAPGPRLSRHHLTHALSYIDEHLDQEIPLRMLAESVGLSPFHFCRVFKQSTGLSPHRYVVQRRVERARELLLAGNERIAAVATRVGFCDQSHLTAHFKRTYGVTPREFRQRAAPGSNGE